MINAAEARKLKENIWHIQLEQIERAIKETVIMGGTCIYYKTSLLNECTIEWLRMLGYKVEAEGYGNTEISWES